MFSLLKHGFYGTFHHISKEYFHRYYAVFDFKYNALKIKDGERTKLFMKGFEGKRLMYWDS
ncbi:MAG: transposase [Candidatus Omnitrophica bacterium]|nr:transposase [Candidatus Omnitrophota bacterium]